MGETVNKLQLVNVEKLNQLINLLGEQKKNEKVLQDVSTTSERLELLESHQDLLNSLKRKSSQVGIDKMNFLKKKQKYLSTQNVNNGNNNRDPENPENPAPEPTKGITLSKSVIKGFFVKKNIKETEKGIKFCVGKVIDVTVGDVVNDLTHNLKKKQSNLSEGKRGIILRELKKLRMPAHYIKNDKIKAEYVQLSERPQTAPPSSSASEDDINYSPIPGSSYYEKRRKARKV